MVEVSHCPFCLLNVKQGICKFNFYGLWFGNTGNRTKICRSSSRRSVHSTTKLSLYVTSKFIFQERTYKQTSSVEQIAIHFALDGNMLHKDSDEARRQRAKSLGGDLKRYRCCHCMIGLWSSSHKKLTAMLFFLINPHPRMSFWHSKSNCFMVLNGQTMSLNLENRALLEEPILAVFFITIQFDKEIGKKINWESNQLQCW